jgi:hypothetical protein
MSTPFTRLALIACSVFVPGVACSLILTDQSLPCRTNADCTRYSGSHCDLQQGQCAQGSPADAAPDSTPGLDAAREGGRDAEAGSTPDGAVDSSAQDSTVDSSGDAGADAPQDAGDADAAPTEPDWNAVQTYLDGLYDPAQSLLLRSPGSTQYWTMPDNALAAKAFLYLPQPETAHLTAMTQRFDQLVVCGCLDVPGHPSRLNHFIDPLVNKGAQIPLTPTAACFVVPLDTTTGATCSSDAGVDAASEASAPSCPAQVLHEDHPQNGLGPDTCNASSCNAGSLGAWNNAGQGAGYADILVYEILNYRNRMASAAAIDGLWQTLYAKWDGLGMNDAADGANGHYSTYKLALFKLAARAIGQTLPPGVEETLVASQGANGGFRNAYNNLGIWTDDVSDAGTTALVVLAYRMPTTDY